MNLLEKLIIAEKAIETNSQRHNSNNENSFVFQDSAPPLLDNCFSLEIDSFKKLKNEISEDIVLRCCIKNTEKPVVLTEESSSFIKKSISLFKNITNNIYINIHFTNNKTTFTTSIKLSPQELRSKKNLTYIKESIKYKNSMQNVKIINSASHSNIKKIALIFTLYRNQKVLKSDMKKTRGVDINGTL